MPKKACRNRIDCYIYTAQELNGYNIVDSSILSEAILPAKYQTADSDTLAIAITPITTALFNRHTGDVPMANEVARETTTTTAPGTLYQTLDGTVIGTYLATNSKGQIVLETSPGQYKTYTPTEVEEVRPWTLGIKFVGNGSSKNSGTVYHYIGNPEWKLSIGDLLYTHDYNQVVRVVSLNTKSPEATKELKATKLLTEPLSVNT